MFAFFVNDEFKGFWSNKIGDIFVQATCSALGFAPSQTEVVFFHFLDEQPEHFTFDANKTLVIQRKVVSTSTVIDPETNEEVTTETESFVTSRTISADPFFTNGTVVQDC
jgi:hypothetical protein